MIGLQELFSLREELKAGISFAQRTQATQTELKLKKELAIVELAIIGYEASTLNVAN